MWNTVGTGFGDGGAMNGGGAGYGDAKAGDGEGDGGNMTNVLYEELPE